MAEGLRAQRRGETIHRSPGEYQSQESHVAIRVRLPLVHGTVEWRTDPAEEEDVGR